MRIDVVSRWELGCSTIERKYVLSAATLSHVAFRLSAPLRSAYMGSHRWTTERRTGFVSQAEAVEGGNAHGSFQPRQRVFNEPSIDVYALTIRGLVDSSPS
jgi:hypothetical protein